MKTMNDLYGDGSEHEACPKCGMCKVCGDCVCSVDKDKLNEFFEKISERGLMEEED